MAVELRGPDASTSSVGERRERGLATRQSPRSWILHGLLLLLGLIGTGFVLTLGGDLPTVQYSFGPVAERPLLPKVASEFDTDTLRDQLEEIAKGHEGTYGVSVLEPISGTRVSLRGDEGFMSASIGKLPVLATLYQSAARGQLDLEEQISVVPEDIQDYGNGENLTSFPADYSLSLRQCAYNLVNHSDNIAWAMLNRRLGEDRIRAELEGMGIKNSQYSDHLSGYFTTPDEVLVLLEKISDPKFTSEKLSSEMLDAMTQTDFEDRIPEKLPADVRVAHKTGSYSDNFGDAGVVFYRDSQGVEKHYYLAALARGTSEYDARDAIQQMSLAVYEALRGVRVDPEWRRGTADRFENVVDGPLATQQPAPAQKAQRPEETTKPSLNESQPLPKGQSLLQSQPLPEGQQNVVPSVTYQPTLPVEMVTWEPVDYESFTPVFPDEIIYEDEGAVEEEEY
ncbi:MAG: serine hydrolase [Rubrobacter sp.]|nr:serine hydrolase [Rubrobacter sp.]